MISDIGEAWVAMWTIYLVDAMGVPMDTAEALADVAFDRFRQHPITTESVAEVVDWLRSKAALV